jgi:hypothetical protein
VANLLTTNCQQLQSRSATFCFLVLEFICLLGAGIYLPPWYWNLSASLVLEFICLLGTGIYLPPWYWNLSAGIYVPPWCWNLLPPWYWNLFASLVLEFICLLHHDLLHVVHPRLL